MDGNYILIIAIIVALVVAVIIIFIVYATSVSVRRRQETGKNDNGTWKTIGTSIGPLPSYFFSNTLLINSEGLYLSYCMDDLALGLSRGETSRIYWNFDGQFLKTNGLYVNLVNNEFFLTETPGTTFLFDAYNFYIATDLGNPNVPFINPQTGQKGTVTNPQLYVSTTDRWFREILLS